MTHWLDVNRNPNHRDIMRRQTPQDRPNTSASSPGTTTTIGNCPCTSAPGVITPTVTAKFSHRQAYRWKRTGLMSMLNDIDGFNVTSEPVAVWNTDTPTNSYISADVTRTVGADSDVYVLTVTEDSTHGWKLNFSIKSGASPNIADEIDWTEVCVSPNAPSPSKSNAVVVLDTETMTSEDGDYINHPGCAGCLVPAIGGLSECSGFQWPEYLRPEFEVSSWYTGDPSNFTVPSASTVTSTLGYVVYDMPSDKLLPFQCYTNNSRFYRADYRNSDFGVTASGADTSNPNNGTLWGQTPIVGSDGGVWMMSLILTVHAVQVTSPSIGHTASVYIAARFGRWNYTLSPSDPTAKEYTYTQSVGTFTGTVEASRVAAISALQSAISNISEITLSSTGGIGDPAMNFPSTITFSRP